jgi:ABC-type branched-subunit amino acid transport system ATPase component
MEGNPDMALLEAQTVTKIFGGLVAVGGVDLAVEARAIVSLIGPNGAGKTTFFNCLTGLYRPEEGDILFDGNSLVGLRSDQIIALGMARTYQNIRLFGSMTAIENVLVGQHVRLRSTPLGAIFQSPGTRREEQKAEQQARELLAFVGLAGKGDMTAKKPALRRPTSAGSGARAGQPPQAAAARRAGRRYEPTRDRRHDGTDPPPAPRTGDHNPADRT